MLCSVNIVVYEVIPAGHIIVGSIDPTGEGHWCSYVSNPYSIGERGWIRRIIHNMLDNPSWEPDFGDVVYGEDAKEMMKDCCYRAKITEDYPIDNVTFIAEFHVDDTMDWKFSASIDTECLHGVGCYVLGVKSDFSYI